MKNFIYFSNVFEDTLNQDNLFDKVNKLDIEAGGVDFNRSDLFYVLTNYTPKQNVNMLTIFHECDMEQFVKNLQNIALSFSYFIETATEEQKNKIKNGFVIIKIDKKNYGKQKLLCEIANTITIEKNAIPLMKVL